jgi:CrcB protein
MQIIWLVALGGFIGAAARFGIASMLHKKERNGFPLSTLIVNLSGSFLLGFLAGCVLDPKIGLFFGTGVSGSFTTFSTFKVEIATLMEKKKWAIILLYAAASYAGGICLAWGGFWAGSHL